MLGPRDKSTLRLNISQTFYPIGAASGILLGKYLVFQDGDSLSAQMASMTPEQIHIFSFRNVTTHIRAISCNDFRFNSCIYLIFIN